jgi:hypothetical protein
VRPGDGSDHGDLVATFDSIHVAPSPVSPSVAEALDCGHAVAPATLIAELGDAAGGSRNPAGRSADPC